ncbi:acyl-coenzyme A thioesterase THEM4-like isoform X3 [Bos indicus]|uniref:Acyl-coenzyme A thioesterase THEM4-like isoform X3 n=1 Tax=Bos indicus TaxID=9915 RepID=A0ABM4R9H9_BOSIN|nr:acyl-coenzyme A thioesterase THEM4-like isoform X3 [Bos indicus x Bos taurus]
MQGRDVGWPGPQRTHTGSDWLSLSLRAVLNYQEEGLPLAEGSAGASRLDIMLQRGLRWLVRLRQAARLLPALAGQPRMLWSAWAPAPLITVSRSHLHSDSKDYSLPNSGWSPIMVRLYNELMEKTVDGTWTRLPGYCRSWQFLKEGDLARIAKVVPVQTVEDARLFLRITEMERLGFEIIHGGALGTMIDTTLFMTAYCSANAVFTGTMTITFKSPITLGSVVRLEAHITGMEGRKVFLSCEAQSSDRTILFAEASDFLSEEWMVGSSEGCHYGKSGLHSADNQDS